jgi:hypothetical protein
MAADTPRNVPKFMFFGPKVLKAFYFSTIHSPAMLALWNIIPLLTVSHERLTFSSTLRKKPSGPYWALVWAVKKTAECIFNPCSRPHAEGLWLSLWWAPVTRRPDRVSGKSGPWRGPRIGAVSLPLPPADRKLNIC